MMNRMITCCEADFPGIPTESGEYDVGSILRRLSGLSLPSFREQDARLPEILGHTREAQLYALSVFAFVNFHAHLDSDAAFPCSLYAFKGNDTIYHAAFAANSCVEHDFIPPIAIRIASWLATSKARFGIDVRKEEMYDQLQPLWKAHDDYLARLQEQEALRLAKISGAPHLYRCANDGCGIRATNKAALKQCGGSCPPERKPRYCTAHCQRAVRRATNLSLPQLTHTSHSIGPFIGSSAEKLTPMDTWASSMMMATLTGSTSRTSAYRQRFQIAGSGGTGGYGRKTKARRYSSTFPTTAGIGKAKSCAFGRRRSARSS